MASQPASGLRPDSRRWMEHHKDALWKRALRSICIPGTHDSGAYTLDHETVPGNTIPNWLCEILNAKHLRVFTWPITYIGVLWSVCQNQDIGCQLRQGVRYLDLRVAKVRNVFHLVHTFLGPPLEPVMIQVQEFLQANPMEVVLLDFNHVYGFESDEDHARLHNMVRKYFAKLMVPPDAGLDVTYGQVAGDGKQVLAFYVRCNKASVDESARRLDFWPHTGLTIQSPWPKSQSADHLSSKLRSYAVHSTSQHTFFVLQGVLTPIASTVARGLIRFPHTLYQLSIQAHSSVLNVVNESGCKCIVVVDFITEELVQALIASNFRL